MHLKLVEPLRELFKDEVRELAAACSDSRGHRRRHPFPGPGLAIRILGEVTAEAVAILQAAEAIVDEEIRAGRGCTTQLWQASPCCSRCVPVGVMGDARTYENVLALRAVESVDGMTADWARLPTDLLARSVERLINEVRGVNRVVYDISSKPPATIEWE